MADGFKNTFEFLTKQCENAVKGFEKSGIIRPFALPESDIDDFTEESLEKLFDRKEFEDQYIKAVNATDTENIHKEMMVPSLKNDFIAATHRDVFLRHTGRIKRFIAEAYRRKNHSIHVHPKRKEAIELFESLKARED